MTDSKKRKRESNKQESKEQQDSNGDCNNIIVSNKKKTISSCNKTYGTTDANCAVSGRSSHAHIAKKDLKSWFQHGSNAAAKKK
jgi:hypothetical protein